MVKPTYRTRFAVAATAAALCTTALAYDGPVYVQVPAPLLKLSRDTEVNPQETIIRLSRERVEVEYRLTASEKDAVRYLYVPVGTVDNEHSDNRPAFSGDPATDPLGLKVTLDGEPIPFETAARATMEGVDISAILRNAGVPLTPFGDKTADAVARLAPAARLDLEERGALTKWGALWTLDTTYWRRHTFIAGKAGTLKLAYKPVFGAHIDSLLMMRGKLVYSLEEQKLDFLCLKPDQLAEIRNRFRARKSERPFRPYRIYNIPMKLENANPQYGSIYGLTFTVDMRRPGDILTSCGGKFKRSGPAQYTWKEDFAEETPDLKLFFLEAVTAEEELKAVAGLGCSLRRTPA